MEFYGQNQVINGSHRIQHTGWSLQGGNTGIEESMWRLGLGSNEAYPERPGASDCVYYIRTGFCGYGSRCRYNHPRDRAAVEAAVRATGEYPERVGEPPCQFYLKTGICKFGASCKFDHPKHGSASLGHVQLNSDGYPLRTGQKECSYYLKMGQCKFGKTCKFHHPQTSDNTHLAAAPQFYQPVQSPSISIPDQYGATSTGLTVRPSLFHGSYVQGAYGPAVFSPGVFPVPGWSPYSANVSPMLSHGAQPAVGVTSIYGVAPLSPSTQAIAGLYPRPPSFGGPSNIVIKEQTFPERPGEPECQFYMRTGDCNYGSSCRFHHPREGGMPKANSVLSPLGLPLRPGAQSCAFYLQNGHCKFGSACKFDHPIGAFGYNPSVSGLDFSVAPYQVGSLLATLVPKSSTDLQPEMISASKLDPYLGNVSSSSITFSKSITLLPFPDMQISEDVHQEVIGNPL